ncbi:preprotein translocase subunit YajC [Lactococcus termiticola]|uniref:Preprotein translocase subunit YajC n=1 Tax=Lactococcus termiticola TaxID=2169526 RepID=A0A2R5HIW0_9LACT|nr:preprotein translocase subunit YajC [Lactococcus termiticola]GBG96320.1 hypothetical protein NtB2_00431 [Lactococcus termiticola]
MDGHVILNSSLVFIGFILVGGLIYSLMSSLELRRRRKRLAELHQRLSVGCEVMFSAGLTGVIHELDEEFCQIRLADQVLVKVSRYAITAIL